MEVLIMMDFDKMIIGYAKTEHVQAPIGFEARIDQEAERISKRNIKPGFRTKMLRPSYAAAVISICILIISGVAYASGILSRIDVGWNGKTVREYYQEEPRAYTKSADFVEESADEYAFRQEKKADELKRIGKTDESGQFNATFCSGLITTLGTLDELKAQISGSISLNLKLPSFVPAGYELESVKAGYYLSADYIDINMPPTDVSVSENGRQMQAFKLPEAYKNHVYYYQLTYKNSVDNRIDIIGNYEESILESTFGVTPNAEVSHPLINGFQKSIYYSDSYAEGDTMYTNTNFVVSQETKAIEAYSGFVLDFKNSGAKGSKPEIFSYDSIRYQIYVTGDKNIGEAELVRIVESLDVK
jgi:hypothetical protein